MESMRNYVVRRAREEKNYRRHADAMGLDENWLSKIAQDAIPDPGVVKIEKAYHYYKGLEPKRNRATARAA